MTPSLPYTSGRRPCKDSTSTDAVSKRNCLAATPTSPPSTKLQSQITVSKLHTSADQLGLSSPTTFFRASFGSILSSIFEVREIAFSEILTDGHYQGNWSDPPSSVPTISRCKPSTIATLKEVDVYWERASHHRPLHASVLQSIVSHETAAQFNAFAFAYHAARHDAHDSKVSQLRALRHHLSASEGRHLSCEIVETLDDHLLLEMTVSEHLFDKDAETLFLKQVDALTVAMVGNAFGTLTSLTSSMPVELISRTTPNLDNGCPSTLHPAHWIEYHANLHPNWIAVEIMTRVHNKSSESEVWTYTEPNSRANRIANVISEAGLRRRMIGMCLDRSLMSFAVTLAILKSGNVYLPIEDSLPVERKILLLEDSDASMLFASDRFFGDVGVPGSCKVIDVESQDFHNAMSTAESEIFIAQGDPDDDAYLLYTSGSTGKPKGCLVSQGNLSSFVEAQSLFICANVPASAKLGGRGKYLCLASRAFDVQIGEITLAWRHGFAAITASRSMLLDNLDTVLSTLQITHASFVPSLLDQKRLRPEDTPHLVFLLSGGEKMSARVKKDWASHDRVRLVNAYGPTEVTIGCCSARISADSDVRDIGTPLGDTVAHVSVPETSDYALRGMTGELCFTGSLVGKGYYKRPEAKGFEDDFNGQRMYRTGDMVRLQENGHLHHLNRKDDQVKIRGQRVELGEVSERVRMVSENPIDTAALVLKHPHLARPQLVVFNTRAASKRKGPKGPKIMLSELGNNGNRLKEQCRRSLPSYMVPDLIIPLEFMPLATNSGKSDSKSLASIFSGTSVETLFQAGTVSMPTNETLNRELNERERRILEIITSTNKQIPKHAVPQTTAVELGVDSLSAMTLLPKLRAKGYSCTLTTLLGNPTLASLAKLTEDTHPASGATTIDVHQILTSLEKSFLQQSAPSNQAKIAAVRPCLPLQEAIVAQSLDTTISQSDAYVYHFRFELKEDVVVPCLRSAWESLVHTHEILRTCFAVDDDRAVQIVLHASEQESSWASTQITDPKDINALQASVASSIVSDIAIRAPIRVLHVMCNGERDLLIFSIHHALYDGSSSTS